MSGKFSKFASAVLLDPRKSCHRPHYTTRLESLNVQIPPSNRQDAMFSDHLPPRVVLLVLGRSVSRGGGGRATSSQSPEPGGGKPTPGTSGGRSLRGDTGVGNTLFSVSSSDSLSDMEATERVISLERSQFSTIRGGLIQTKLTLIRMNVGSPTADTRP